MSEPFTLASARALHQRLTLGWSTFDDEGNERPVPVTRDRKGRDTRKPAGDWSAIPSAEALLERFGPPRARALPKASTGPDVALPQLRQPPTAGALPAPRQPPTAPTPADDAPMEDW